MTGKDDKRQSEKWRFPSPEERSVLLNPYALPGPDPAEEVQDIVDQIKLNRRRMGYPPWRVYTSAELMDMLDIMDDDERREVLEHKHQWAQSDRELGIEVVDPEGDVNAIFGQHDPTPEELEEAKRYLGDDPLSEQYWT